MKELNFMQAFNEGMREEMRRDKTVFFMGEDVQLPVFGFALGLVDEFGPERIRNTPLSEAGFVGAGVGAAAAGMRPVIDLSVFGFGYLAMDQIASEAAKMRYMFGGQVKLPLVICGIAGIMGSSAAHHSESPHGMFMNVPGLKMVAPSTPYDCKGLLKAAIRDDNPVLFFQFITLGLLTGVIPEEDYIPRHKQKGRGRTPSKCYRNGSDARKFGESKSSNPYWADSYEFYEWRAGWLGMQAWIKDHPDEDWPEAKE